MSYLVPFLWFIIGPGGGLVGGVIGKYCAGQAGAGFLLGFFLGPLGWLVIGAGFGRRRCPDCAEWGNSKANVCKHCGYRFRP